MGRSRVRIVSARELIDLALGLFFRDAVALLNPADELITFSTDALEIVVGQLAPFFLRFSRGLLPFSFNLIPVHETSYGLRDTSSANHSETTGEILRIIQGG